MTAVDMGAGWDRSMDEGIDDDFDYEDEAPEGRCTCRTGSDPRADLCDYCVGAQEDEDDRERPDRTDFADDNETEEARP